MRKPSLTLDTFVAALAVLGVSGAAACSKAERSNASPEPATASAAAPLPAEVPAPTASAVSAEAAASAATGAPEPPPSPVTEPAKRAAAPDGKPSKAAVTATPVDAGPTTKKKGDTAGGSMSCGAGMCSADMKKGN